eukprot:TRINITY_DN6369_c0_g1_i5.p1 TRINITY_DN6369_c0_g1~~TRINITY_DN6369_c0_g1_i5.p1  ORF type:complete len:100 (+),score=14.66 TRINITY_DN6369_c0_g1_i5:44-343(+)
MLFFFFFFKQKTAYEMLRSLVGSEMCIRDRFQWVHVEKILEISSPTIVSSILRNDPNSTKIESCNKKAKIGEQCCVIRTIIVCELCPPPIPLHTHILCV